MIGNEKPSGAETLRPMLFSQDDEWLFDKLQKLFDYRIN